MKIGVPAPGSSSHFFVLYLMAKAGLQPTDATIVGVGGGAAAVEAIKNGVIDATANFDPVITRLEQDGVIRIVTDTLQGDEIGRLIAKALEGGIVNRRPWYEPAEKLPDQSIISVPLQTDYDSLVVEMPARNSNTTRS